MAYPKLVNIAVLFCLTILLFTVPAYADLLPPLGPYVTQSPVCFLAQATPSHPAACIDAGGSEGSFSNIVTRFSAQSEVFSFGSTFTGNLTFTDLKFGVPLILSGPMQIMVTGRTDPNQIGTFATEMLSLDLSDASGNFPGLMLRESPTLHSTGQTTITPIGNGLARIDSFFDIFTELSIDGGLNWEAQQGPAASVVLTPAGLTDFGVPEPGTMFLVAGAALVMISRIRR